MAAVLIRDKWVPDVIKQYNPKSELGRYVQSVLHHLPADAAAELVSRLSSSVVLESALYGELSRPVCRGECGPVELCSHPRLTLIKNSLVSRKVVTTAGAQFLVDAFQGLATLSLFRYHGLGTGTTAEAASDTALVTELTTELNPDNTRATGTLGEGASAVVYRSVGTNAFDAAATLAEHGLFSSATVGSGTLLDRSLISPTVAANSGDAYQNTYDLTVTAGS